MISLITAMQLLLYFNKIQVSEGAFFKDFMVDAHSLCLNIDIADEQKKRKNTIQLLLNDSD